MRYTAPVIGGGKIGEPRHLHFAEDIPQAEFNFQTPIALGLRAARDQRLRVDLAPVAETRLHPQRGDFLDKGTSVNRLEQA